MRIAIWGTTSVGTAAWKALNDAGHDVFILEDLASLSAASAGFDAAILTGLLRAADAHPVITAFASITERLILASDQSVYAPYGGLRRAENVLPSSVPISEMAPLRTVRDVDGLAGKEMLEMEAAAATVAGRIAVRIVRLPVLYGAGEPGWFLQEFLLRMQMRRPAIVLPPEVGNFRWTHGAVRNMGSAIAQAALTPTTPEGIAEPQIYHVGEGPLGYTPTVGERLHALARAVGYRGQIVVLPKDLCPPHLISSWDLRHDLIVNDHLIRRQLSYKELIEEKQALAELATWYASLSPTDVINPAHLEAEDVLLSHFGLMPKKK